MKIKLSEYVTGFGVKTEIDGVELPEVTSIGLVALPGEVPRLSVEMLATDINVEINASVDIFLTTQSGQKVYVEQLAGGRQRLSVVQE